MDSLATTSPVVPEPEIGPKPWGIPAILLVLALPVLLWGSSLGIAIAEGTPDDLTTNEIIASFGFTIFLDFVLIGLAAGLSLWRYKLDWSALGFRPLDRSFWWWPVVAAAAAHIGIIAYALVLTLIAGEGAAPDQELDELFESRLVLPLAGVATVIMAPLAEEIFFRGFIFAGLIRPFGLYGAMAASGVVFGMFHITSADTVGLVLPFAVVGALFAWLYQRTGSLWASIAAHLVFNLVSFAFLAAFAGSGS